MGTVFSELFVPSLAPYLWPGAPDSLLFFDYGGLSTLPALIVPFAVFAMILSSRRRARPSPAYDRLAASLWTLGRHQSLESLQPVPAFAKHAHLPDDAAYLDALRGKLPPWGYLMYLVILAAVAVMFAIGVTGLVHYKAVTLDAVHVYGFRSDKVYPLTDAQYADITCPYGGKESFEYRLHYPGTTILLWERTDPVHGLNTRQVIERLAQVDNRLTQLHVPIHRLPAAGNLHDDAVSCLDQVVVRGKLRDTRTLHRLAFGE